LNRDLSHLIELTYDDERKETYEGMKRLGDDDCTASSPSSQIISFG